ncbi:glycosyltransferase [Dyella kyungheensis]|uniref:Glycosyltransferase n=1 Tax=Dyella kyungheensis TaxID=1242174 RepID=A0ABS2JT55_9GAMM|nr:glycosyltransferase [Dyella kyungheensis]MBM7121648.1 glycosyltransferase [Dyella kyungheensis]
MNETKVSVFLPTYARFKSGHLERAIQSVLAQSWSNFELLVIDDGSIDGTAEYVERCASSDPRVKHIRLEKNTGLPAYALAKGFAHANGQYLAWMFDDCELRPTHLQNLMKALLENPVWGMVYARAELNLSGEKNHDLGAPFDAARLASGDNFIPNVCVVLPRSTIERVGWYDPHVLLKRLCDWDLWHRISQVYEVGFVDEVLATEYGFGLVGSLGRASDLERDLVMRYAATMRNERLMPNELSYEDGFRRDLGFDLNNDEASRLELSFFGHAFSTLDVPRAVDFARRLAAIDVLHGDIRRFARQQGAPATSDAELLFVASKGYAQWRLARNAEAIIDCELRVRHLLDVADQRMALIEIQQGEIKAVREEVMTVRESEQQLVEHLRIYRDAADQRMELLHAARQEVDSSRALADQREGQLQVFQQELEDLKEYASNRQAEIVELRQRCYKYRYNDGFNLIADGEIPTTAIVRQVLTRLVGAAEVHTSVGQQFDAKTLAARATIFSRAFDPALARLPRLIRRAGGRYALYLDDNFWECDATPELQAFFAAPSRLHALDEFVRHATVVVVNSGFLAERMRRRFPALNISVVPAHFDFSLIADEPPAAITSDAPLRVGYAGTTRGAAFDAAVEAIRRLLAKYPGRIEFEFIGFVPEALRDLDGVTVIDGHADYGQFLELKQARRWHVGLAPLLSSPFAQAKTNNKYREYGALGIAGIYSNVEPYASSVDNGVDGLLVDDSVDAWFGAIERLLLDREACVRMGRRARMQVRERHDVDRVAAMWNETLSAAQLRAIEDRWFIRIQFAWLLWRGRQRVRVKGHADFVRQHGWVAFVRHVAHRATSRKVD